MCVDCRNLPRASLWPSLPSSGGVKASSRTPRFHLEISVRAHWAKSSSFTVTFSEAAMTSSWKSQRGERSHWLRTFYRHQITTGFSHQTMRRRSSPNRAPPEKQLEDSGPAWKTDAPLYRGSTGFARGSFEEGLLSFQLLKRGASRDMG